MRASAAESVATRARSDRTNFRELKLMALTDSLRCRYFVKLHMCVDVNGRRRGGWGARKNGELGCEHLDAKGPVLMLDRGEATVFKGTSYETH